MEEANIKQKILNSLSGKIEVIKVVRNDDDTDISIICKFIKNGKSGNFYYTLEGIGRGIDWVRDYEEEDGEDIYGDIHDWVNEHIEWTTSVKLNGKEI